MPRSLRLLALPPLLAVAGCLSVKTEPIEVKPIHITVDVNVKVEKALDEFFGELDKKTAGLPQEQIPAAVQETKP